MIQAKKLNIFLLIALGIGFAIPYPKRRREEESSEITGNEFAFIVNQTGEPIYASPGTNIIGRLPVNTYAGVLTGKESGSFKEVAVGINSGSGALAYFFWIDASGFEKVIGRQEASKRIASDAIEKSNQILDKIVSANA